MALALDRGFENRPWRRGDYIKPPGRLYSIDQDPIFNECSLLLAPSNRFMANLAPRCSPNASGPIGDPTLLQVGRAMAGTRWGLVLPCATSKSGTHSSWAGITHPKISGFTLWAVGVILSGISSANDYLFILSGSGGDEISIRLTQYVAQYVSMVNWSGPTVNSTASAPYFPNTLRGSLVSVVGRTHTNNNHEIDAYCPISNILHNGSSTTNIPGVMSDTTDVTVGWTATAGRSGVLYAGYWNRDLRDSEVERLLYRPASLFRHW